MSHWYLASWVWNAALMGGCWQPPAGAVAALDLRPQSAQAAAGGTPAGWGFFGFDTVQTLAGADYFGNDLAGTMTLAQRTAWRNKLSIATALSSTRLIDILTETLGPKSDTTLGTRAKPILPNQAGDLEIYLGTSGRVFQRQFAGTGDAHWARIQAVEQDDYLSVRNRCLLFANAIDNCVEGDGSLAARLTAKSATNNNVSFSAAQGVLAQYFRDKYKRYLGGLAQKYSRWAMTRALFIPSDLTDEGELPPETTYTDNFNRANSTNLGADWSETQGNFTITSNQLDNAYFEAAGSSAEARYEHDLSSADHYAQIVCVNFVPNDCAQGVCSRFAAGARTAYRNYLYWSGASGAGTAVVEKLVSGTATSLGTTAITVAQGDTAKGEPNGSTIKTYQSGTQRVSVTDTSITGNLRTGVISYNGWQTTQSATLDDFEAADLAAPAAGQPYSARVRGVPGMNYGGKIFTGRW